jgi:hypothetical protein
MLKIAFATATAAAFFTVVPMISGTSPAHAQNLKTAQVDIEVGRDRDEGRYRREREGVSVGVGPGGVRVGPRHREHCRTVTTTVRRDDGSRVRRTERRCN